MTMISHENATCQLLSEQPDIFSNSTDICVPDFDKSLCWYNVSRGEEGHRQCPFTFCPSVPGCESISSQYHVTRNCYSNGTWGGSIYSACLDLLKTHSHCIVGYCRTCPDMLRETVINVSLALSVISVAVLVSALVLFSIFDSIQCRRLSIHKNLAVAFVFRFAVLAIWTVANTSNAFHDCGHFNPIPLRNWEWLCKAILWLVIYFQVASVMWMLIEGLYLYSRFTVFGMRHSESPYAIYLLSGWGIPLVMVSAWTIVHESRSRHNRHSFCWLPYAQGHHLWILAGTMGLALILNVLFLLAIVVILVQKLRTENSAESKKIWRTVKATILLVPLLGVSNIPLFYEPAKPNAIYMLGSAILQHSQGIFIAVLYCFLNGEIQNAVKRQLSKAPFNWWSKPQRYETERTYIPEMAGNIRTNRHLGTPMSEQRTARSTSQLMDTTRYYSRTSDSALLDDGPSAGLAVSSPDLMIRASGGGGAKVAPEDTLLLVLDKDGVPQGAAAGDNLNEDSLQRIRESVSQFFNENFDKIARSNAAAAAICAGGSLNSSSTVSYSEMPSARRHVGITPAVALHNMAGGAGCPLASASADACRPTIAASEKSDSTFLTSTNATLARKPTLTSLSASQTPLGTQCAKVLAHDLKNNHSETRTGRGCLLLKK